MTETNSLLIIDDEEIARDTLAALLENSGYHLEFATNGQEGIKRAVELWPDVILLDVMMPGLDGFEVCRRLRRHERLAEIPIIMITALDDKASRLTGLEAGADDFLSKPFDSLELRIRLRKLGQVNRYRHLREERDKLAHALQELTEKNAQLKHLSVQILEAQEKERRRLAVDLHDEIGQTLTGLKLTLQAGHQPTADVSATLAGALTLVTHLLHQVRELSLDLRPTILDDFGLWAALDWLFKRVHRETGLTIHHNIDRLTEYRPPKEIEVALFRVTQEALTNIVKHAQVNEATINFTRSKEQVQLIIMDQGKGFDSEARRPGTSTGLSGMQERISLAGGELKIQSTVNEGTILKISFPVSSAE